MVVVVVVMVVVLVVVVVVVVAGDRWNENASQGKQGHSNHSCFVVPWQSRLRESTGQWCGMLPNPPFSLFLVCTEKQIDRPTAGAHNALTPPQPHAHRRRRSSIDVVMSRLSLVGAGCGSLWEEEEEEEEAGRRRRRRRRRRRSGRRRRR